MPALLPADFPRIDDLGIDSVVVLFAVGTSVLTGVLFGLIPALRLRRLNLVESLSEDGAAPVGAGWRSRDRAGTDDHHGRPGRDRVCAPRRCVAARPQLPRVASRRSRLRSRGCHDRADLVSSRGLQGRATLCRRRADPRSSHRASGSRPRRVHLRPAADARRIVDGVLHSLADGRWDGPGPGVPAHRELRAFSAAIGMRLVAGRDSRTPTAKRSPIAVIVNRAFAQRYLGDAPLGVRLPMAGILCANR